MTMRAEDRTHRSRLNVKLSGGAGDGETLIRVLIVAEIRLYREGLEDYLHQEAAIAVAGTAATCDEALAGIVDCMPDIVLMDLRLPDGPRAARRVLQAAPGVKIVALGIAEVGLDIIEWAEAGISGYVSRDGSLADLVTTLRSVSIGEMPCSPKVAAALLQRVAHLSSLDPPAVPATHLTFRQMEIIRMMGQGLTNKEIAKRLSIALPTVKNHVHAILEKMGIRRRAEVIPLLAGTIPSTIT